MLFYYTDPPGHDCRLAVCCLRESLCFLRTSGGFFRMRDSINYLLCQFFHIAVLYQPSSAVCQEFRRSLRTVESHTGSSTPHRLYQCQGQSFVARGEHKERSRSILFCYVCCPSGEHYVLQTLLSYLPLQFRPLWSFSHNTQLPFGIVFLYGLSCLQKKVKAFLFVQPSYRQHRLRELRIENGEWRII